MKDYQELLLEAIASGDEERVDELLGAIARLASKGLSGGANLAKKVGASVSKGAQAANDFGANADAKMNARKDAKRAKKDAKLAKKDKLKKRMAHRKAVKGSAKAAKSGDVAAQQSAEREVSKARGASRSARGVKTLKADQNPNRFRKSPSSTKVGDPKSFLRQRTLRRVKEIVEGHGNPYGRSSKQSAPSSDDSGLLKQSPKGTGAAKRAVASEVKDRLKAAMSAKRSKSSAENASLSARKALAAAGKRKRTQDPGPNASIPKVRTTPRVIHPDDAQPTKTHATKKIDTDSPVFAPKKRDDSDYPRKGSASPTNRAKYAASQAGKKNKKPDKGEWTTPKEKNPGIAHTPHTMKDPHRSTRES